MQALKRLKLEVETQRGETHLLRTALQECEACRIKKPTCADVPYPCFEGPPRVDCRNTDDGPLCGPCPPGYKGNGIFCDRDACGNDPCYENVACYPALDDPFFRCGPCPTGYRGDGINCVPAACQRRPAPCYPDVECYDIERAPYYRLGIELRQSDWSTHLSISANHESSIPGAVRVRRA